MGVDTLILMDHSLRMDAGGIDRQLRPCLDTVKQDELVWRRHGGRLPADLDAFRWQLQLGEVDDFPLDEAEGPCGIHLSFGRHLVIASPTLRWGRFIEDQQLQAAVLRFARSLGSCIGAQHRIFLPDSASACAGALEAVYEGGNMSGVLTWLSDQCAPPAPSITSIRKWLTDEEMLHLDPQWNGDEETRTCNDDGYWVDRRSTDLGD